MAAGLAALLWNQWQLSRGMGGRFPLESVATLVWNTQSNKRSILESVSMDGDEIYVCTQTEVIDDNLYLRNDVPVGKLLDMVKILFNQWNINHIDQATLLGMGETEYAMLLFDKFDQTELENREIPNRIYYLLGINARLRALFASSDLASRWMLSQNEALDGLKPIQIIERDGVAGMIRITRYLNFYVFN